MNNNRPFARLPTFRHRSRTMGCNGGGGKKNGGGGWQVGQNRSTKPGKAGKPAETDTAKKGAKMQRDKLGRPLNHGLWRNGFRIDKAKGEDVQCVGVDDAICAQLKESLAIGGATASEAGATGTPAAEGEGGSCASRASAIVGFVAGGDPIAALLASTGGHGKDSAWAQFNPAERRAASTLGYDARSWDAGEVTSKWAALSPAQRDAAALLGYTRHEWDVDADAVAAEAAAQGRGFPATAAQPNSTNNSNTTTNGGQARRPNPSKQPPNRAASLSAGGGVAAAAPRPSLRDRPVGKDYIKTNRIHSRSQTHKETNNHTPALAVTPKTSPSLS